LGVLRAYKKWGAIFEARNHLPSLVGGVPGGAARTRPFQGLFSQVERPRKETRVDAGRDRIVGSPATPARSPQDDHIAQGQPCNDTANGRRSWRARRGMAAVSYREIRLSRTTAGAQPIRQQWSYSLYRQSAPHPVVQSARRGRIGATLASPRAERRGPGALPVAHRACHRRVRLPRRPGP